MTTKRPSRVEAKRRAKAARTAATEAPTLPPELAKIIDSYEADKHYPRAWKDLEADIHDVMNRSGTKSRSSFRKQLGVLFVYLSWRHSEGLDTGVSESMKFSAIDDFYKRVGDPYKQTTRNDYRSLLRKLAQSSNPGIDAAPTVALGHRPVRPGYSAAEEAAIRRVALRQRQPTTRRQLCIIVGLSAGAGLASLDLREMRTTHVIKDPEGGYRVDVPGSRPRTVWVRYEYEELIQVGITGVSKGHLLIGKKADRKKVTGSVLDLADLHDFPDLDVARMRTTWLAWLLTRPVPLTVVLHAAGLESARTLTDIINNLPAGDYGSDDLRGSES